MVGGPHPPRILVLNYPNNPTGSTYTADGLQALAAVARKYDAVVLSDEIYGELHFEGRHVSIARYYPEGTIISSGLSKWCGAGGWRLGTFFFPKQLRWLLEAMGAVASETYTSASAPIQYAAVRAFQGGMDIDRYLVRSRRILGALARESHRRLTAAGLAVAEPHGAFYLFPDFGPLRERFATRDLMRSDRICNALLSDTDVAILPGLAFDRPTDRGVDGPPGAGRFRRRQGPVGGSEPSAGRRHRHRFSGELLRAGARGGRPHLRLGHDLVEQSLATQRASSPSRRFSSAVRIN